MIPIYRTTLILIFFASSLCHADILFLNLNDSPSEIEAARKAIENHPERRGEKLIVWPLSRPSHLTTLSSHSTDDSIFYCTFRAFQFSLHGPTLKFDFAFHAVALTLEQDHLGAVKDPVDGGIGKHRIGEHFIPLRHITIAG